jgi:predicted small secreted protein
MKKRFMLLLCGIAVSIAMLFTGCGGNGAEDTGKDGQVGGNKTTASNHGSMATDPTSSTNATNNQTAATSNGGLMDDIQKMNPFNE